MTTVPNKKYRLSFWVKTENLKSAGTPDLEIVNANQVKLAIKIAAEGRKFGLYLLLSTQRPPKVHENIVSQCDNLLLMRMNSVADVGHLTEVFSFVPPSLLARATGFKQGEALVAGKVVPAPTFVRFGARVSEEGGSDVPTDWARAGA